MLSVRHVSQRGPRLCAWPSRPTLLVALVALGVGVGPSVTQAEQLTATWVDNSSGEAGFIVQRATGTTGPYGEIAQLPPGVTSYTDTTVSPGTTYCYQVAAVNGAGASDFAGPACASPPAGFSIAVGKAGTGAGTVVSSPEGITCGTLCSAAYLSGTAVTLTATPATGSTLTGWSGGGCSGTSPCTMAGNGSVTVTATFDALPSYTLSVTLKGPGTVSSSSGGISCGSVCAASYVSGSTVTLTAAPGRNAKFNGWSGGGCSGTGTCTVTLAASLAVSATFSGGGKK